MLFIMILLLSMVIEQILLYYDYVFIYQLYVDMVWFYYHNKYNNYKNTEKIYNDKNIF